MFGKEPGVILGALAEIVKAVIPALIIFGILQWTSEQVAAVMFVVGVAVSSFTVMLTRSQTVTTEKANDQIKVAVDQPSGTSVAKVVALTEAKEAAK